jgi:hypothetical protein
MRLTLEDGTSWPDPTNELNSESLWELRHRTNRYTRKDVLRVLAMAEAYCELCNHPAFTLAHVRNKVSMIRKACRKNGSGPR